MSPFRLSVAPSPEHYGNLGVNKGGYFDEFNAVRLGRHRDTSDWLTDKD
jgi:hypothetical protein